MSTSTTTLTEPLEWVIRERRGVQLVINTEGQKPQSWPARVVLTTERLVVYPEPSQEARELYFPYEHIHELRYMLVHTRKKRVTIEAPTQVNGRPANALLELNFVESGSGEFIALLHSLYHQSRVIV